MNFLTQLYQKAQKQGTSFTALDAMKLFAIINMTADHIGAYMFPEAEWWRAIGRITFPVWFFLVGYSQSRTIGRKLVIYALILMAIHPLMEYALFPTNALVTIIICRLALNYFSDHGWLPKRIPEVIVLCITFSFITLPLFEYGSTAVLYAVFGRMVRLNEKQHFNALVVCCYVLFIGWQFVVGDYDIYQSIYIVLGTAWVVGWLAKCPNTVIWQDWASSKWKSGITILSRNTLPYYFYHRALFQFIGALILGKTLGFTWIWLDWDDSAAATDPAQR